MHRAHLLVACLALAACGKQVNEEFCYAHPTDELCVVGGGGRDSSVDGEQRFDIAHLGDDVEDMLTNDADVVFATFTTINTTDGTISPAPATAPLVIASVDQDSGTPVMVVQAGSFVLDSEVRVLGDKPLVFVALRTMVLNDRVNASADLGLAGAGGGGPGMGMGAGMEGQGNSAGTGDAGGGGGGFGSVGGAGGNAGGFQGGPGGVVYGDATVLVGGSGGGAPSRPSTCTVLPGAGGGVVQLTALVSIDIPSAINVSGGGGAGGIMCTLDGSGGAGGGSGGMIYLQSPLLLGTGALAAVGGGGGEGASQSGTTPGVPGADGGVSGGGGDGGVSGNSGGDGGDGGEGTIAAEPGATVLTDQNGGGGGGGVGRIYILTTGAAPSYVASPPATML